MNNIRETEPLRPPRLSEPSGHHHHTGGEGGPRLFQASSSNETRDSQRFVAYAGRRRDTGAACARSADGLRRAATTQATLWGEGGGGSPVFGEHHSGSRCDKNERAPAAPELLARSLRQPRTRVYVSLATLRLKASARDVISTVPTPPLQKPPSCPGGTSPVAAVFVRREGERSPGLRPSVGMPVGGRLGGDGTGCCRRIIQVAHGSVE